VTHWNVSAHAMALVALPLTLIGGPALSGCHRSVAQTAEVHFVVAAPVQSTDAEQSLRLPGEIHARYEMPLSFRVSGQVVQRLAQLGDEVKKGQVLAELDDDDAERNLHVAKAALDAAEQRLIFATRQRDRDEEQSRQDLISQLQLDQTRDAYAAALDARVQAREQLYLAENQLRYTKLTAAHDGAITSQNAEVGQFVSAGQTVFGFAWSMQRNVYVDVPEDSIAPIIPGRAALIRVPSYSQSSWSGRVREVSPAGDPQSHTYRVKVGLDAPDARLILGMTVEVDFPPVRTTDPVRIAASALFHDGDRPAVWVVRRSDSRLELRPVTVLRYRERDVLVSNGLHVGESVVMQGVHTVSAGEKVTPTAPPHPEDAPL
jgi:membrane fusion protein, multidrug efflux system